MGQDCTSHGRVITATSVKGLAVDNVAMTLLGTWAHGVRIRSDVGRLLSNEEEAPSLRRVTSARDSRDRLQRTYRRIAPLYDLLDLPLEYGRYRRMRAAVFSCVTDSTSILDCGAGTGRNEAFYPGDAHVIPFDLSMEMLQHARLRMNDGAPIVQADAMQLPFASHSFDAAVATFLFCVLPDEMQAGAIQEICRVLKPGGRLVLLEYVLSRNPLRRAWMKLWSGWIDRTYGASFTRRTAEHLRRAGIVIEQRTFLQGDTIEMIVARSGRKKTCHPRRQ
ncbi:MAG TPA: class I SAM-dependent methyltransferase [Thermoanaerobaculia bacterium]|nr:class I SAM-dependent methyltransferase [Thermoanaerobaculia bacterium]